MSLEKNIKIRIVLFTRYPEPGKTKTRMIPALGAEGAARLQEAMTRHCLNTLNDWSQSQYCTGGNVEIQVRYFGGDKSLMTQCFGDYDYQPQGAGDLGQKMQNAMLEAFDHGACQVILTGADCPSITKDILNQAVAALTSHDVVFGPAFDGGYYLIGASGSVPDIFNGVNWGTESVFEESIQLAHKAGARISVLEKLSDVDEPEDLAVWESIQALRGSR